MPPRQADPRMRLLTTVGVAPARPLTVAEEEELMERQKLLQQLQHILSMEEVDLDALRNSMVLGGLNEPPTRVLSWQLVLLTKPACRELWDFYSAHRRRWYNDIKRASACLTPTHSGLRHAHFWLSEGHEDKEFMKDYEVKAAELVQHYKVHNLSVDAEGRIKEQRVALTELEFDLRSVAYVFARALEVECIGGPITFWCFASFCDTFLEAGGAFLLAHMVGKVLGAVDEQLLSHLQRHSVPVMDIVTGWLRRLFRGTLHIDVLVPIYDRLVAVGPHFAVCVAVALLQGLRQKVLLHSCKKDLLDAITVKPDPGHQNILPAALALWKSQQFMQVRKDVVALPTYASYLEQLDDMLSSALALMNLAPDRISQYSACNDAGFIGKIENFRPGWKAPVVAMGTQIPGAGPLVLLETLCGPTPDVRACVDPSVDKISVLQCLSKEAFVVLERAKGAASVLASPREFVLLTAVKHMQDGTRLLVSQSISHPLAKENKTCTRGEVYIYVWVLAPMMAPVVAKRATVPQSERADEYAEAGYSAAMAASASMAGVSGYVDAPAGQAGERKGRDNALVYPKYIPSSKRGNVSGEAQGVGGLVGGRVVGTYVRAYAAVDLRGNLGIHAGARVATDNVNSIFAAWRKRFAGSEAGGSSV